MHNDDYHLPGGNGDVARLIIRSLIPDALPPGDVFDVADKRMDYAVFDRSSNPTRIRQSSIVYNVRHQGPTPHVLEPDTREVLIKIGRASCRERVCQYGWRSVVAVSLKKKKK